MPTDTQRLRIQFAKRGPIKYCSHLDLVRAWERSLRRAGIDLAYSGGFNPRPKLQLAAALALGHTAEAELLDVWLERPMPVGDVARTLAPALPDGLTISQVHQVDEKEPALQTQVVSADYRVTIERYPGPVEACHPERIAGEHPEPVEGELDLAQHVRARIERVLAAAELEQEWRGRRYDLRPLIERLYLERVDGDGIVLGMQLAARAGATARPEAVLKALGMGGAFARYHRRRLLLAG